MKSKLFLALCIITFNSFSQREANWWYFGYNAGLDFNGGAPVAVTNGQLMTEEGCASISDAAGNLLFYTDGIKVWNKNHVQMPNGFGLMGHTSTTQSAVIIQKPGSSNIYYIFTTDAVVNGVLGLNGIRYTEVDMSLNVGLGNVTANKNILLNTPSCEKITAIRHCNNKDIWVVTHDWNSDAFRTYLVTSTGVNIIPVVSNAGLVVNGAPTNTIGQLKGSPDGKKLASAIRTPTNRFELFDFNNSTGIVSNAILFPQFSASEGAYGVEFSPDGTKMYGTIVSPGKIYQFNLCAGSNTAIANSGVLISADLYNYNGALQLGPDKKIYVAKSSIAWLGVINNPDILGAGCNYVNKGISLNGKWSRFGLPNFVSSYFKQPPTLFTVSVNCLTAIFAAPTVNITNCSGSTNAVISISWNFGDPVSAGNNTSTLTNPTHAFTSAGTYTVTLVLNYECSNDTIKQNVTVVSYGFTATTAPTNILCNGQCTGKATAMPFGGTNPYSYSWSNGQTTKTITGLCEGTYTVTITDGLNAIVTNTGTIIEPAVLTVVTSANNVICNGDTGSATVNGIGGTPSYFYLWSNGQITQTVTNLSAGTYTVIVTDNNGCSKTDMIAITEPEAILLNTTSTPSACIIQTGIVTTTISAGGGNSPYTYHWSSGHTTQIVPGLAAGTYTITITDANGCTQTQAVTVTNTSLPMVTVSATITKIAPGESTQLNAIGGGNFLWTPSIGLSCSTCFNPTAMPIVTTNYCVQITDSNGCTAEACVTIDVEVLCGDIFVPTAFSPTADIANDLLCLYGTNCIQSLSFIIYDRWGNKVFETNNPKTCWDGMYKGKKMNEGIFVYYLYVQLQNKEVITKRGNITLIK